MDEDGEPGYSAAELAGMKVRGFFMHVCARVYACVCMSVCAHARACASTNTIAERFCRNVKWIRGTPHSDKFAQL
jgi:hypothetical protein